MQYKKIVLELNLSYRSKLISNFQLYINLSSIINYLKLTFNPNQTTLEDLSNYIGKCKLKEE